MTTLIGDNVDQIRIQAVKEALRGLVKISMKADGLRSALLAGGSSATVADLKKRFESYLEDLVKGRDVSKVRIVLK